MGGCTLIVLYIQRLCRFSFVGSSFSIAMFWGFQINECMMMFCGYFFECHNKLDCVIFLEFYGLLHGMVQGRNILGY